MIYTVAISYNVKNNSSAFDVKAELWLDKPPARDRII